MTGANPDEKWMHGDWFYTRDYSIFGREVKATESSLPDNLTRWIIKRSRGFTRKKIEKISRSVRAYVYLVLTSQIQARSGIVGNSVPAVDAQQAFKGTFEDLKNEDRSTCIDIDKYQGVPKHALSKVDFSVRTVIYMLPSDSNFHLRKTKRYNNKISVSNKDLKFGANRNINKKKLPMTPPDAPKVVIPTAQHDNLKMLTEKHKDEKLAITLSIVRAGLIAFLF